MGEKEGAIAALKASRISPSSLRLHTLIFNSPEMEVQ